MAVGKAAMGALEEDLLPPAQLLEKAALWLGLPGIMTMMIGCF